MSEESEFQKGHDDKLNASYRADGWPTLTDVALRIEPIYVESQARAVAEYALGEIQGLQKRVAELEQALDRARRAITSWAGTREVFHEARMLNDDLRAIDNVLNKPGGEG
jgi:hypothetical protein